MKSINSLDELNVELSQVEVGSLITLDHFLGFYFNHQVRSNSQNEGYLKREKDTDILLGNIYSTRRVLVVNQIGEGKHFSNSIFPSEDEHHFIYPVRKDVFGIPHITFDKPNPLRIIHDYYPPKGGLLYF